MVGQAVFWASEMAVSKKTNPYTSGERGKVFNKLNK